MLKDEIKERIALQKIGRNLRTHHKLLMAQKLNLRVIGRIIPRRGLQLLPSQGTKGLLKSRRFNNPLQFIGIVINLLPHLGKLL